MPHLALGMVRINNGGSIIVIEHRAGFEKRDPMFPFVTLSLLRVPLEPHLCILLRNLTIDSLAILP
jgi:hypothetical protein